MPASLSCSLPFVPVETWLDDYLVGKDLVILLFECVVGKMFYYCVLCIFFPSWCLHVGTLNLIASIPDPSILIWYLLL